MDKKNIMYYFHGGIKGSKELEDVLKDIRFLEDIPNSYDERSISIILSHTTEGRDVVRYDVLDGDNLKNVPRGKKNANDPRGLREFGINEGKLVETSKE